MVKAARSERLVFRVQGWVGRRGSKQNVPRGLCAFLKYLKGMILQDT